MENGWGGKAASCQARPAKAMRLGAAEARATYDRTRTGFPRPSLEMFASNAYIACGDFRILSVKPS